MLNWSPVHDMKSYTNRLLSTACWQIRALRRQLGPERRQGPRLLLNPPPLVERGAPEDRIIGLTHRGKTSLLQAPTRRPPPSRTRPRPPSARSTTLAPRGINKDHRMSTSATTMTASRARLSGVDRGSLGGDSHTLLGPRRAQHHGVGTPAAPTQRA
ncbi:hypothetical protein FQR65_LT18957 [Abscondita terminalis]|nr:hypothetical protein FQR65_LT18957 [Abscondita terminalis]